jgi:hypothetical protein
MDEIRINAAAAEMNAVIQSMLQRNVNLAGDLAVANSQVEALKSQIQALHQLREVPAEAA